MGTKVHRDSYLNHTMRDLNKDFNSSNWHTCYRENGITNGQQYYKGFVNRTTTYPNPNSERDALKQRMLEHEAIFKAQLQELHRLYKTQRELMEDVKKKELHRLQVSNDQQPSSSSSSLRGSHLHGGFPLFNSGYGGNSPLSCTREYNAGQARFPYLNGSASKEFEGLDSRPLKVRKKLFDLQLPAEKNVGAEDEEGEDKVDLNEHVRIEVEAVAKGVNRPEKSSDLVNGDSSHLRNGFSMNSGFENRVNSGLVPRIFEAGSSKGIMHQHSSLVYSDRSGAAQSSNGHLEHREAPRTSGFFTSSSYNNSWAHSASSFTQKRSVFDPSLNSIATINRSQLPLAGSLLVSGSGSIAREPQACSPFSDFSYLNSNRNDNSCLNVRSRTIDIDLNKVGEENKTAEDNVSALPWLKHKPPVNDCETTKTVKKILGIPIFDNVACTNEPAASNKEHKKRVLDINLECEPDDEPALEKEKNRSGFASTRDVMIDLNSCVVESDELPLPLSEVPPRANRILEIDLEAPPVQESEDDAAAEPYQEIVTHDNSSLSQSKVDKTKVTHDEDLRNAAEAIFAISSFCPSVEEEEETSPSSENSLLWFADVVSSFGDEDGSSEKQLIYEEIDDFEAMTLQLQEMREDKAFTAQPVVRDPEETCSSNPLITRPRRGQSRRGRQRKDFQRDILPGLSTLSRQEVTEDLQTFGGLMRAMGHHWNLGSARRNGGGGRGRRRAVAETLSNDVQSRVFEVPLVHKLAPVLEDRRSITGWGKTTRRPRRQRCSASGNNNTMKAVLT